MSDRMHVNTVLYVCGDGGNSMLLVVEYVVRSRRDT